MIASSPVEREQEPNQPVAVVTSPRSTPLLSAIRPPSVDTSRPGPRPRPGRASDRARAIRRGHHHAFAAHRDREAELVACHEVLRLDAADLLPQAASTLEDVRRASIGRACSRTTTGPPICGCADDGEIPVDGHAPTEVVAREEVCRKQLLLLVPSARGITDEHVRRASVLAARVVAVRADDQRVAADATLRPKASPGAPSGAVISTLATVVCDAHGRGTAASTAATKPLTQDLGNRCARSTVRLPLASPEAATWSSCRTNARPDRPPPSPHLRRQRTGARGPWDAERIAVDRPLDDDGRAGTDSRERPPRNCVPRSGSGSSRFRNSPSGGGIGTTFRRLWAGTLTAFETGGVLSSKSPSDTM